MRKFKRAAIVGAGLLAFSGLGVGAAQALPDPGQYMVGDTYKEPTKAACEADGNSWEGVGDFSCLGPNDDGSYTLRIDSIDPPPHG
ncbi:hypothetical protein [Streptomyces axinellae]|uniref:Uncharacterized protein n=1 Tax=Streptomyces axinellae TaxID=552788 RepID=A0ABP6D7K6_9ACTN